MTQYRILEKCENIDENTKFYVQEVITGRNYGWFFGEPKEKYKTIKIFDDYFSARNYLDKLYCLKGRVV